MPATLRLLFACSLVAVCGAAAGPSTTLAHLPNTGINAIKVDTSGNIYVAGFQGTLGTPDSYDAFVAKLSPDGSKILYSTKFAGGAALFPWPSIAMVPGTRAPIQPASAPSSDSFSRAWESPCPRLSPVRLIRVQAFP